MNDSEDLENEECFTIEAGDSDDGERLDRFFANHLSELSRSRLKTLIKEGHASQDGRTIVEPNLRVKPGDLFSLEIPPAIPAIPKGEDIALDIVFEDAHLIVIDKPAGLVVHPAAGNWSGTLVNALIHHCGDSLSGIGGVKRPGIVHRIDKETSGLMVVAKTDAAHKSLALQFADHGRTGALEREYEAIVWGVPYPHKGTIETQIGRKPQQRQKMGVLREGGKTAITHYEVKQSFGSSDEKIAARVACQLETGRTHQIRVHMAHIGNPLLGDRVYGTGFKTKSNTLPEDAKSAVESLERQALHASHLGFEHPVTDEILTFDSPLPHDMSRIVTSLSELKNFS